MHKLSFALIIVLFGVIYLSQETESIPKADIEELNVGQEVVHQIENESVSFKSPTVKLDEKLDALNDIVDHYQSQLRFPPYSTPLSEHDFDRLNPNHYFAQPIYLEEGMEPLSLKVQKYYFNFPEDIAVQLTGEGISNAKIEVTEVESGAALYSGNFTEETEGFAATIPANKQYPQQLQLTALINVNGGEVSAVAHIEYVSPPAEIVDIDKSYVEGAHLIVPLKVDVKEAGIYRLTGNLFTESGKPVAHLKAREVLKEGTGNVLLKVHQTVLNGDVSQFQLKSLMIERMSSHPLEVSRFGRSLIESKQVGPINLNQLKRTPYQPSQQEVSRLEFLQ